MRASLPSLGGLLWKFNPKMSDPQKAGQRKRLKAVDSVITALVDSGRSCVPLRAVQRLPTEAQMPPKDKYTIFSRKGAYYRKHMHRVDKFTRITARTNPEGF